MDGIRPALGNDVDDPAYSAPEFGRVAAVDDAEFSDGLLRRGVFLNARGSGNVVGAVYRDEIVVNVLPGEREFRHGLNDHVSRPGGCVADLHAGIEQCEIDELASVDRQGVNLLLVNDRTDHGAGWLRHFTDVRDLNPLFNRATAKREINAPDSTQVVWEFLAH